MEKSSKSVVDKHMCTAAGCTNSSGEHLCNRLTHSQLKEVFHKSLKDLLTEDPILKDLHKNITHQEVRFEISCYTMYKRKIDHTNVYTTEPDNQYLIKLFVFVLFCDCTLHSL